ncbi:hypothetical protein WA026_000156, partial [Henosepilachna vigintioctopunctata]
MIYIRDFDISLKAQGRTKLLPIYQLLSAYRSSSYYFVKFISWNYWKRGHFEVTSSFEKLKKRDAAKRIFYEERMEVLEAISAFDTNYLFQESIKRILRQYMDGSTHTSNYVNKIIKSWTHPLYSEILQGMESIVPKSWTHPCLLWDSSGYHSYPLSSTQSHLDVHSQQKEDSNETTTIIIIKFPLFLTPNTVSRTGYHHTSQQPPRITEHPVDTTVARHEPATLNCHASGEPEPTITWFKDGALLRSAQHRILLPTGNLFFLKVTQSRKESDGGVYWCEATNALGKAISRNATLTVATGCESQPCEVCFIKERLVCPGGYIKFISWANKREKRRAVCRVASVEYIFGALGWNDIHLPV